MSLVCVVFGRGPCILLIIGQGRPSKCVHFPLRDPYKFSAPQGIHLKVPITMGIKRKKNAGAHGKARNGLLNIIRMDSKELRINARLLMDS